MTVLLLLYKFKLNCLIFSFGLNSSLMIFIRTYTVTCQNVLDRLRVYMNIILYFTCFGMNFVQPFCKTRLVYLLLI